MRDARYDRLFEPLQIGPVTTKNRFYQVPHCTGSGWERPRILAGLREMKAEGGWGVVTTEYCSIHPSTDDSPYPMASLWDEGDVRSHSLMTEKVHAHGALAAVELCAGGARMANLNTREVPLAVSSMPNPVGVPWQSKAMDKADIKELRRWHLKAAKRAKRAGFDIVYIYATHGYLLSHFLSPIYNDRSDEYGGSLENRVRLLRELIEETKEAVGDSLAVALRFSAETNALEGEDGKPMRGETEEIFAMIGELPDLWDVNINDYSYEMGVSRFVPQGCLEPYLRGIKSLTSKPIVSVGRLTSPDMMASWIKEGLVDLIGAARPSIADPFLPKKIEEGRLEDIRECIGCNICYAGDGQGVPIRCTQNPTMSEEWRRGWHPEVIAKKGSEDRVLIVGGGPAGLEAAHALGKRGYEVMLAEAERQLGGRVAREARLPGLSEWIRVRDYRLQQIAKMDHVALYPESEMTPDAILEVAADHLVMATGAKWSRTAFGIHNPRGVEGLAARPDVFTPDDLMAGATPQGPVLVFDDEHYYMATVLAELVRSSGQEVIFVTPADSLARWSEYTYDKWRAQQKLMEMGVEIILSHNLSSFDGLAAEITCAYSGKRRAVDAKSLLLVTARKPNDGLYKDLLALKEEGRAGSPKSITPIGDCEAPGIIAQAVFSGHRYARELDAEVDRDNPLKYDRVFFED